MLFRSAKLVYSLRKFSSHVSRRDVIDGRLAAEALIIFSQLRRVAAKCDASRDVICEAVDVFLRQIVDEILNTSDLNQACCHNALM